MNQTYCNWNLGGTLFKYNISSIVKLVETSQQAARVTIKGSFRHEAEEANL